MPKVQDTIRDILEEDDDEDLLDWISDGEDTLDTFEPPVQFDDTFPSTVFLSGLPVIDAKKYDKLMNVIAKLVDKFGKNDKLMPMNKETNMTEGCLIISYEDHAQCKKALEGLDGVMLDKSHRLKVTKFDEFDQIVSRQEAFRPERTLNSFKREDFREWLLDKKFREQFLLRYQQETEIYWHDMLAGQPVLCYGGEREKRNKKIWCDAHVKWSPTGSYLATFHQPGIALWAGPDFEKKVRFAHNCPKFLEFSPSEEYLMTWNGTSALEADDNAVKFFRVITGECVRSCRTPTSTPSGGESPHFVWSADGRYFAECNTNTIYVRDTEDFELIKDADGKRKGLKYERLSMFSWSPKENIMAIWTLEESNNPARLALIEIPSRKELALRARTQVEATMHWQSEGDYLCLLVTKKSKTGKKGATNLEILRIREKGIPVDIVEIKDAVRGFYWESRGSRFAVLTSDEACNSPKLLIYHISGAKCENITVTPLPSNSFNELFWAPDGQYFVCAAVQHGDLLFGGITADNKLEISHKDEHFMLTDVQWDPSSRYVITAVTQPMQNEISGFKYSMEAGYAIWTFQGRLLFRQQKEKLWHVSWRPHPPSLLPPAKVKDIRKSIKQFSKRYDAIDETAKEAQRQAFQKSRREKTSSFKTILDRLLEHKESKEDQTGWMAAWEDVVNGQEWKTTESHIEQELSVTEDLIA